MHKAILHIAIPSIVSNITVPLLGLIDTAIVGHLGAASYIGAIAVGSMLFNMVYWLFGFLRMGTGGLTAQAFGAGNSGETLRTLARSAVVSGTIAVVLILMQLPLANAAFCFIDATPEVETLARQYFSILVWGAPAVLGLYSFCGWFLGMQNARFPMYIAVVQNVVNIAASLLLVVVFGWKVEGVATGTLIAQYAGLLMAVGLWLMRYRRSAHRHQLKGCMDREAVGRFFSVNRDIFLRTLCLVAVTTGFTSAGAAQGDITLAVNALLMQLFMLFSYVMDGFAYAGEALGGRYYGARNAACLAATVRQLFAWGVGLAAAFTAVYAFGGMDIVGLLTNQTDVVAHAAAFLPYAVAIPVVSFPAFLLDGLYIGTTSTRYMLVGMAVAAAGFYAALLLLRPSLGNHALWCGFLLYLGLRGAVQALFLKKVMRSVG